MSLGQLHTRPLVVARLGERLGQPELGVHLELGVTAPPHAGEGALPARRVGCAPKPGQLRLDEAGPVVEAGGEVPAHRSPASTPRPSRRDSASTRRSASGRSSSGTSASTRATSGKTLIITGSRARGVNVAGSSRASPPRPASWSRNRISRIGATACGSLMSGVTASAIRRCSAASSYRPLQHVMNGRAHVEVLGERAAAGGEPELPDHVLGLAPPAQAEQHVGSLEAQPVDRRRGGPDARGVRPGQLSPPRRPRRDDPSESSTWT